MKKYNQLPRKGRTFEGSEPSGMTIWISQLHKKPWPVCVFHQVHHGHTTSHAPWTSSGQHPLASVSTTSHILSQEVLISAFGGSGGPFKFLALSAFTLLPSGSKLHLLLQCCLEGFINWTKNPCYYLIRNKKQDFPGGTGDMGSIPAREDSTCGRATKLMCHDCWACALESGSHSYWACMPRPCAPQQEKPLQWKADGSHQRVAPANRN